MFATYKADIMQDNPHNIHLKLDIHLFEITEQITAALEEIVFQ